jgi:hypothetical protein
MIIRRRTARGRLQAALFELFTDQSLGRRHYGPRHPRQRAWPLNAQSSDTVVCAKPTPLPRLNTEETDSVAVDAVRSEPVSVRNFPANREINREFRGFRSSAEVFASGATREFKGFQPNSYAMEQGIVLAEQGNHFCRTGNSSLRVSAGKPDAVTKPRAALPAGLSHARHRYHLELVRGQASIIKLPLAGVRT